MLLIDDDERIMKRYNALQSTCPNSQATLGNPVSKKRGVR